jgi:hypothetical protein
VIPPVGYVIYAVLLGWALGATYYAAHMAENISITAEPRAKIHISLVGVEYDIQPPKAAFGLKLAVRAKQAGEGPESMRDTVAEWVIAAFGKAGSLEIEKRIEDETDALDFPHLMQLMQRVTEMQSGNPTLSS